MKIYLLTLAIATHMFAQTLSLQILGSGGPELDGRTSASYILWIDGKARALIDTGSGSMLGFEKYGAKLEDLELIAISHLHIDHVVDLPSYIKAGYFTRRSKMLPIVGTIGNKNFPSMSEFLELSFGENGTYRYMSDVLTPKSDSFEIRAVDVKVSRHLEFKHFHLDVIAVHHGGVPALAFKFSIGEKSVVISGDTNNEIACMNAFSKGTSLLVAHHAISQDAGVYAKNLHMTPLNIGVIASTAKVKKLLLSHRMLRTIAKEKESLELIRQNYKGEVVFAEDGMNLEF